MKRVSIIIPVRDRAELLDQCLSSLLSQDFPLEQCEIIVCDDGSREDLRPVVERRQSEAPGIRLLRLNGRRGPAAARNLGIRSADAPIIVCVDSDILCDREFLKHLVGAMEAHPEWIAAEGSVVPTRGSMSLLEDAPENRGGGTYLSGATAYRLNALVEAGGFDENFLLPACEDAELAARLLSLGQYGWIREAKAFHPVRRVTARTHWMWRRIWKYETILAKRYGFVSFPGRNAGNFPRLRIARAAVLNLPAGRFLEALTKPQQKSSDRVKATLYSMLDVLCGLSALPRIMFGPIPERADYLEGNAGGHRS
jgi:glycosyltransferase involved in cell wall biosynthesis